MHHRRVMKRPQRTKEQCRLIEMVRSPTFVIPTFVVLVSSVLAQTQTPPAVTRLAVLKAEDRRAASAGDLAVIRSGTRSGDPQTARIAVRALGRLERPALVADIVPFLNHSLSPAAVDAMRSMVSVTPGGRRPPDPFRDVRVRRVALEALVTAETVDEATLARALPDPDPQVRRLAMRAATAPGAVSIRAVS